jgi:hypothetical protein
VAYLNIGLLMALWLWYTVFALFVFLPSEDPRFLKSRVSHAHCIRFLQFVMSQDKKSWHMRSMQVDFQIMQVQAVVN